MVKAFFDTNRERFTLPECIHAAHILKRVDAARSELEARAEIEAALRDLTSGRPFAATADRHSDCRGNGGDLGFFGRKHMVTEFDEAVFDLPAGSRSEIFRTPFGFHIAEVIEKRPERIADFEEVMASAEQALRGLLGEQAIRGAMECLILGAVVERRPDNTQAA